MAKRRKRKRRNFELRLGAKGTRIAGIAFGVAMVAATIGCVFYSNSDNGREISPEPPERYKPEPLDKLDRVEGWVPYWSNQAQLAESASEAGFTDLLFFNGSVAEDGSVSLENLDGLADGLTAAGRARTWLTVTNHGGSLQGALIDHPDAHVADLLKAYRKSGCDHLDLDYESLSYAQADALEGLAAKVAAGLPEGAKLSLTLQPVDSRLRPEQRGIYTRLLESPHIYTLRLMMYDYHWRGSLPGALYPLPAFKRLVNQWARYAYKLTLCLPLYGYDWPRPDQPTVPKAEVVTMRDLRKLARKPRFDAVWMNNEGELAARYREGGTHYAALPSLRAIQLRVQLGLDAGVPGVSFWHLGCADMKPVVRACARDVTPKDAIRYDDGAGWDGWIDPFKRRVCTLITADGTRTLEQIADANGIPRSTMYRFNEQIADSNLTGRIVYIPR
jgi:hypothetical protein